MIKHFRQTPVDLRQFNHQNKREAKYGLPEEVRFCRKCVISNQRPNSEIEHQYKQSTIKKTINFDEEGICDACRVAEEKADIDWLEREAMLREVCDRHRRTDGHYDCLCPGSGGKDSIRAYQLLTRKYDMHPLMATFAPTIFTEWGRRNLERWSQNSGDHILWSPNGRTYRLLARFAVENLFYPQQPFILGLKNAPPKIAAQHDISLVFYGENEAEYGNPKEEFAAPDRLTKYFTNVPTDSIALGGVGIEELTEEYGLKPVDLKMFLPGDPELFINNNIQVLQLGYYERWHPQGSFYEAMQNYGFEISPDRQVGTHTKYTSIDDLMDEYYYWTYFIKFGIGRATADVSQEIRSGDITREEGISLVARYEGEFPSEMINDVCDFLSISKSEHPIAYSLFEQPKMDLDYFMHLADRFRSPHLWDHVDNQWRLRYKVTDSNTFRRVESEEKALRWEGNKKSIT